MKMNQFEYKIGIGKSRKEKKKQNDAAGHYVAVGRLCYSWGSQQALHC